MEKHSTRLSDMVQPHAGSLKAMEKKVADYLLLHEEDLQDLSISDISIEAGVSKATVVRFCKSLGFNGLKDFKIWYEAGKSAHHSRLNVIGEDSSLKEIAASLHNGFSRGLEASLSDESLAMLSSFVDHISDAEKIAVMTDDGEAYAATFLTSIINVVFPGRAHIPAKGQRLDGVDLAVVISMASMERDTFSQISDVLLGNGIVDAITTKPDSLLGKTATHCLALCNEKVFGKDDDMTGRVSLLVVLSLLEVLLTQK